jgi:hypothetical protein
MTGSTHDPKPFENSKRFLTPCKSPVQSKKILPFAVFFSAYTPPVIFLDLYASASVFSSYRSYFPPNLFRAQKVGRRK